MSSSWARSTEYTSSSHGAPGPKFPGAPFQAPVYAEQVGVQCVFFTVQVCLSLMIMLTREVSRAR